MFIPIYSMLTAFYGQSVFNTMGVAGIYVLLVLFYLFALFQILGQRKVPLTSPSFLCPYIYQFFIILHSNRYFM